MKGLTLTSDVLFAQSLVDLTAWEKQTMLMRQIVSGFVLVLAGLLPLPSGAADRQVEITRDADYFGFDLRTERDLSLDQCKQVCIDDNSCRAFTYNPRVQWCFLKSDFGKVVPFNGAIAGRIVEASSEPDIGAPLRLSFVPDSLLQLAREMNREITSVEDHFGQEAGVAAREAFASGNFSGAAESFKRALAVAPDDVSLWNGLSDSLARVQDDYNAAGQSVSAALNAYQQSRTVRQRTEALATLARAFEKTQSYRAALDAYKAALAISDEPATRAAYQDLRQRQGFRVVNNTVEADSGSPRACVQFSEELLKRGVDYSSFVTLDGAAPRAMEAKGNQICVEGLTHGQRYKVALRRGLPSSVDETLENPVELEIYVRDRSASVRFTGDNFVLPSTMRRGIPVVSVNTEKADLKLYRVGDRNITALLANSQFLTQLDGYNAGRIESEVGELVWEGSLDIATELNREVVTSLPVDEVLPQRKPGIYMITAQAQGGNVQEWDARATQWFLISDTGISTWAGTDGLNVFVRSLATAKPLANVELQLLARNNEVLGTGTTDADGRAVFAAGLMRGAAASAPAIITARNGEDDYVFLDMTRAGFDLSDRGVTGRAAPGAIDLFAWTERGIYRAGETVHASVLARDIEGNAIERLPLTFIFYRPDGVEERRITTDGGSLGGHMISHDLQQNAMRGTWNMRVYTDVKGVALAQKSFLVEDFIPDRIEFDLSSEATVIEPGHAADVTIDGRFLYGAPGAGLQPEGEVVLRPVRSHPAFANYVFGLADERSDSDSEEQDRRTLDDLQALDENGKSVFNVDIGDLPSTTWMLDADVVVRLREGSGRAVERRLTLPVRTGADYIGIKPEFSGSVAENTVASFHVIGVSASGAQQTAPDLEWKLLKVERNYQWYRDGNSWRYEPVFLTRQIETGKLDVSAEGANISVPVAWGRYRLEVTSAKADGAASSIEFDAGWFVENASTETPDGLEIALDKDRYTVGETARLKISSRFAGEVMVTAGSEKLVHVAYESVGAEGAEIDVPVTEAWGAGAYVTATLFRPGEAQESRMPMRAIGVRWLSVDPGDRKLAISLDLPEKTLPRQALEIPVSVSGAGVGSTAYVTVAAVDVGILNLTAYEAPDPDGWYFGQRRLGMEIRDFYGRLIDGSAGVTGRIRTGGDGGSVALQGRPPTEKLVAFFSGPVELDADGKALISFDIPQFNGTVRVMAVAWSATGVGHTQQDVIVRDPVVVTASLPGFLAPGDESRLLLDIANTDGDAGDYSLDVSSNLNVTAGEGETQQVVTLEKNGRTSLEVPLVGENPGTGQITVTLRSPSGEAFSQELVVPVRPAAMPQTARRNITIAPGNSLRVSGDLLAGSLLTDASVSINVTRNPAFDVPALLMMLDRYPYGCTEQTTSRALPLLYLGSLPGEGAGDDNAEIRKRVQDAIYKVLGNQEASGSFGLWSPGSGDLWLDAYVTDFLTRAREQSYDVPEQAISTALLNLRNGVGYDGNVSDRGNEMAYALYVLARNRQAAISDLRYYADNAADGFRTPLAKAHLAAALSLYGDVQRAQSLFAAAVALAANGADPGLAGTDYGSALRDASATLALAAESRPVPQVVPELVRLVSGEWDAKSVTSTQEQAWTVLAARALAEDDKSLRLDIDGALHSGGYRSNISGEELLARPVNVVNRGPDPVTAVVTTVAAPAEPLAAGGDGFDIERNYYTLDGEEANVSSVTQNERYVVVIRVTPHGDQAARLLLTDLLPAGFEIDNPSLVESSSLASFEWLENTTPAHTEFRFDRFVAAFDRTAGDSSAITVAYVVRAVTPGTYGHPAASVEDMYRPQLSARTATGVMEVSVAQP